MFRCISDFPSLLNKLVQPECNETCFQIPECSLTFAKLAIIFCFGKISTQKGSAAAYLTAAFSLRHRPGEVPSLAVKRRVKLLSDIYPARCATSMTVSSGSVVMSVLA